MLESQSRAMVGDWRNKKVRYPPNVGLVQAAGPKERGGCLEFVLCARVIVFQC
jgi:hypothetical protein